MKRRRRRRKKRNRSRKTIRKICRNIWKLLLLGLNLVAFFIITAKEGDINLKIRIKSKEELDQATNTFIKALQKAVSNATPALNYKRRVINILIEVRQLIKEKRKTRRNWQGSRTPNTKAALNKLTNTLKSKLKQIRKKITKLNRFHNTI